MAVVPTARTGLTKDDGIENYSVGRVNANTDKIDEWIGATPCDSTARPATGLFVGRLGYEHDTETIIVWRDGTGWRYLGVPLVDSVAERDALVFKHEGLRCHRRDMDWDEQWDGTAWRVVGVAIVGNPAALASNITHPRTGQLAVTTDADQIWSYDGGTSAWIRAGGYENSFGLLTAPVGLGSNVAFGAETKIEQITFTHTQGRYEEVKFFGTFNLNAGGSAIMKLRYISGSGTITTAGTLDLTAIATGGSATNALVNVGRVMSSTFQALASGTYTVGVFAQAATGASSGTMLGSFGGGDRELKVEDVGSP